MKHQFMPNWVVALTNRSIWLTALAAVSLVPATLFGQGLVTWDYLPTGAYLQTPLGYGGYNWYIGDSSFGSTGPADGNHGLLQYSSAATATPPLSPYSAPNMAYNAWGNTPMRIESLTPKVGDEFTFSAWFSGQPYPPFGGAAGVQVQGFIGTNSIVAFTTNFSLPSNGSWVNEDFTAYGGVNKLLLSPLDGSGHPSAYLAGYFWMDSALINVAPVITLNPFNQTNYPGYSAALLANASGSPAPSWQWFKTGSGLIAGATNNLYIPANSGTTGVAGSYYAMASNLAGTATSTTATVSFVSAALPPDWSLAFKSPLFNNGAPSEDFYISCLPDSSGNVYAVGTFLGTNTIGSNSFISPKGTESTDIIKQSPAGNPIWAVAVTNNGNGFSQANCVAPAPNNGVYVAGVYSGTNWLGNNMLLDLSNGGTSIFLARFDANGNVLWVRNISGTNDCSTTYYELVADAAGNATLSGLFLGSTLFNSSAPATSTNLLAVGQQGGLAQYDANGTLQWAELTPSWIVNMTYSSGRIYGVMSTPATSFSFGGISLITDRAKSLVALNNANGQAIWLQGFGAPFGQANMLSVVETGPLVSAFGDNVFIAGTSVGSNAAFGPYTVSWPGYAHQYLGRCDTNGTPQFLTTFGNPNTMPWSILAATDGGVYVSGDFDTYSFLGNDLIAGMHLDSIGNGYFSDGFLAKFDVNGNPLWVRIAEPQGNLVNLRGLALATDGVWACGLIKSPTAFDTILVDGATTCVGSPCTPVYDYSGVLAKITDSGVGALPVTLLNPQANSGNFQLVFQSQSGHTHTVQYRTNLVTGTSWQTYSNIIGDGTLETITVPFSIFNPSAQGFARVLTQ